MDNIEKMVKLTILYDLYKSLLTDKQKAEYEPRPIIPEIYHRYMMYGLDPIPKSEVTTQIAKNGIIKK